MKLHALTSGEIFGLITLAHVWRIFEENSLAREPWFVLLTLASAGMCLWAWRVFRLAARR